MKMEWFCSIRLQMNRFVVLLKSFPVIVCISGSGLKRSRPCSRPWPSGPSAWHKPGDNQKKSEGTEPRTATVLYTSHEGFSQTGGRASRQQLVITEIVRCDDSGMLIACFFFFFPNGDKTSRLFCARSPCAEEWRSVTQKVNQCDETVTSWNKVFCFLQLLSNDADADNRLIHQNVGNPQDASCGKHTNERNMSNKWN